MNDLCPAIYEVFNKHGYDEIAFTLIATDTKSGDSTANGNMRPEGVVAMLENCLEHARTLVKPTTTPVQ